MTDTHCPYCSLQCGMKLGVVSSGGRRVPEVSAWEEFPVNEGALCRKGWSAAGLYGSRERLTSPLLRDRRTGEWSAVSWDVALDRVVTGIRAAQASGGPDGVAVFGGGGLTNEKAYSLGKFARVALGTSQIDYNGRWCMSSAASAGIRAFGLDRGLPFPLADVEETDVLVLVGSNLVETMPPAARHLDRLRARGGRVVVIDPRRTPTADRADVALQPVPGTDLALALGVLHLLVASGSVDSTYLDARTTGWDAVRDSVAAWWPERVERVTGVDASEVRELAAMLGGLVTGLRPSSTSERPRVMILTARGAEQHATGTDTVLAWINVALALGMVGKRGAGYGCLTGQGNGQGGREHGQKADQLPGYRRIDDPTARAHVAGVWGVEPDSLPGPGRSAYELLDACGTDTGPSAMLVFGSNIVVSAPNATHVTSRLESLDLLVVCDFVMSETAAIADVVLPVTQWAEETGTMTNLEGRVVLRQKAIAPPSGVRSDLDVIADLAARLSSPVVFATDPEAVFTELGRASEGGPADYSTITYDRVRHEGGVFWGGERLFATSFAHADGRARMHAVEHRGAAELPDDDYPIHLTTGRVLAQYQSGAQTRRVRALPDDGPFVEMHPLLAGRLGVVSGEQVRISTRRGAMTAPARVVPTIRPDTVFIPFHWVGANRLTNDALDPASKMPEFKLCAARLSLRSPEWFSARGIDLRLGARVHEIDRSASEVMLVTGERLGWDRLVLATGAIPTLLPIRGLVRRDGTLHPKVHPFRSLEDCRRLDAAVCSLVEDPSTPPPRAVVIGGGLLGLQVARALSVRGVLTEVVEGANHLLASQVGPPAGAVLARDLRRLGTEVYTGARAIRMTDDGVQLDNGAILPTDLVVLTAGGRPSTALARRAGLMVGRGVVVDNTLASVTDGRIHAIGDCAEHRRRTTGFVPPAWEQAEVLARVLRGEDASYDGLRSVARLRATGLDVAVLGDPQTAEGEGEVVEVTNPIAGSHRRLVVHGGRIVAAALVGDLSRVGLITQLYDRGTILGPDEPGQLLLPEAADAPTPLPDEAEVCTCAGVSAGDIRACGTVPECVDRTRATTGCGGCADVVRRLVGEATPSRVPVG